MEKLLVMIKRGTLENIKHVLSFLSGAAGLRAAFQLVGLAVISLGNCWRLAGCNDVATHINIAEHYSIYYTKHCSVCYIVQLYKSILTYDECYATYYVHAGCMCVFINS